MNIRNKSFDHYRWATHNPDPRFLTGFLLAFPENELSQMSAKLSNRISKSLAE